MARNIGKILYCACPKVVIIITCYIINSFTGFTQNNKGWKGFIKPADIHLQQLIRLNSNNGTSMDSVISNLIVEAGEDFSMDELAKVVNISAACCSQSDRISILLTRWLQENNAIYNNRSATDANQFRAFLLAELRKFPPQTALYKYVKAELLFGAHPINIAAAAATAKKFPEYATELVPLMEPYLNNNFNDEWIDITTPALHYPVEQPTRARYEIIETLMAFKASAYHSVSLLDKIASSENFRAYGSDSILLSKALSAARFLRSVTPACCQKENTVVNNQNTIQFIDKKNRKPLPISDTKLIDQDGNPLSFEDIRNKPFILTFFYTQCTNPLKCASTISRLGALEKECVKNNIRNKIGIYAMTYDPDFDTPSVLKKYGNLYGFAFSEQTRFLKTSSIANQTTIAEQLQVKVNYGGGTVNQHAIQLYIFDRKGNLAAICDNDLWEVKDVYTIMAQLAKE